MKLTKAYLKQMINESFQELREAEIPLPAPEEEGPMEGPGEGGPPGLAGKEGASQRAADVAAARTQTHDIALGKTGRTIEYAKEDFNDLIGGVLQGTGGQSSKGLLALSPQVLMLMFKRLLMGDPVKGTQGIHPQSTRPSRE